MTKFTSAEFKKIIHPSHITLRIQRLEGSVDPDEVAHYEPPHQDLLCLHLKLILFLSFKFQTSQRDWRKGTRKLTPQKLKVYFRGYYSFP